MSIQNIGHAAVKWTEQTFRHGDAPKSVQVETWFVRDNSDDPDPAARHTAGVVLTLSLNKAARDGVLGGKFAQVVLTGDDLVSLMKSYSDGLDRTKEDEVPART